VENQDMARLRARILPRLAVTTLLAGAALLTSAACSLLLDTSATQCKLDADCTARGADFAGMTCSAAGLCVAAVTSDGGDAGADPVAEISAGHFHTCARFLSGKVACWGKNDEGQIGDGKDPASEPVAGLPSFVDKAADAALLSCGEADNCILKKDQTIWCWGANDEGQLGNGSQDAVLGAVQVVGISTGQAPAAGDAFNCAILTSGNVVCWGTNAVGQLGDGKDAAVEPRSVIPVQVSGITDAVELSLGESHACAVLQSGGVVCWGHNDFGQLGLGELDGGQPASSNIPVAVAGLSGVKHVELGEKHSCAVTATHELYCWGSNDLGQLGDETVTATMSPTPVQITGITVPKGVSAAGSHTCAYAEDGEVYCWGSNADGESGQDPATSAQLKKPTIVAGVAGAKSITVGNEHSCAQLSTGNVVCWGHNNLGQLGDGLKEPQSFAPVEVQGLR
jgi:alpha-tubulin suppressor-like RCC1 family protein